MRTRIINQKSGNQTGIQLSSIDSECSGWLERPLDKHGVWGALKEMNGEKARQDGFHTRFSNLCRRVV
jgi:hypothetical protein